MYRFILSCTCDFVLLFCTVVLYFYVRFKRIKNSMLCIYHGRQGLALRIHWLKVPFFLLNPNLEMKLIFLDLINTVRPFISINHFLGDIQEVTMCKPFNYIAEWQHTFPVGQAFPRSLRQSSKLLSVTSFIKVYSSIHPTPTYKMEGHLRRPGLLR